MDLHGKTALILGGAGLVGMAVCRELISGGIGTLLVGGLTEAEARAATAELAGEIGAGHLQLPRAGTTRTGTAPNLVPIWGNVFVRAKLAGKSRAELESEPASRSRLLADDLDELTPEIYHASHLVQLIHGVSPQAPGLAPHAVVDAINTATVLAYSSVYDAVERVLAARASGDAAKMAGELDTLLGSFATPRLVRHVQLLTQATLEAGTQVYVKVGTTGSGGMGLNIPYTHGEEKPSRKLLAKSALAGAHSMLLFLLARTPGAPAVKEIKPAAAITWKRIAFGPIRHRGQPIPLYDCAVAQALSLVPGTQFILPETSGTALGEPMESVFVDTGENGLFSVAEFAAITALGQMEAVTPEEIASLVVREIRGQTTGRDIVAALDGAVLGPSYRAGVLRSHALAESRSLAALKGVPSVAFEILGPPRLSKLLYEAEFLRLAFGTWDAVAAASPEAISAALLETVANAVAVRRAAISVGIPILLPDGRGLMCASRQTRPHRWENQEWQVDEESLDRHADAEWIDLRPANAARWQSRAVAILRQRAHEVDSGVTSSQLDRRFGADSFDIGEAAAWVFGHEDDGGRVPGLG